MSLNRRDIIDILRSENELLKSRNTQLGTRLARLQLAFRALNQIDDLTGDIDADTDLEVLFRQLLQLVLHASDTEHGSMLLLDERANELQFVEVVGDTRERLLNHRIDADTGIVGQSLRMNKPMLVENVQRSVDWSPEVDQLTGFNTQSLLCAPLRHGKRKLGVLEVVNKRGERPFDKNDLSVLRVAAHYVSLALVRAEKVAASREPLNKP